MINIVHIIIATFRFLRKRKIFFNGADVTMIGFDEIYFSNFCHSPTLIPKSSPAPYSPCNCIN